MNEVVVLIPGYSNWSGPGKQNASGTVTLVRGSKNVIVDTGIPAQKNEIVRQLKEVGIKPADVDCVVNSHGHSDHIGNNNLFPKATFLLGTDVSRGDEYTVHDFHTGAFHIGPGISVIATPGHTDHDLSVVVETSKGAIVIVGDLFEHENDWSRESWKAWSKCKDDQQKSRQQVLRIADFIVPGHGNLFRVTEQR